MAEDQPDGIQSDTTDDNRIPSPAAAAARVVEFVKWFGDGEVWDRTPLGDPPIYPVPPLYARDLCALACAVQHGYRADMPSRCLHDPDGASDHDRQVAERAWDEGRHASTETWTRLIGWSTGPNPTLEAAPTAPPNPYRADTLAPRPAAPGVSVSADVIEDAVYDALDTARQQGVDDLLDVGGMVRRSVLAALGITVTDGGA